MVDSANDLDYRFAIEDTTNWLAFLDRFGYVVIKQVATEQDVLHSRNLYWNYFEESIPELKRTDVKTWNKMKIPRCGIMFGNQKFGALSTHSEGAWYLRGLPKLRQVFAQIWATDDLIVSMDSTIVWRPWWIDERWRPVTEGLHLDQNPFQKSFKDCVQGMIPLYDVTEEIGGLEVCPETHLDTVKEKFKQDYPNFDQEGNFLMLSQDDMLQGTGKLLLAKAGDLILWDSRTVHGGRVGTLNNHNVQKQQIQILQLARLTQTINMTPRSMATKEVLGKRIEGFEKGWAFNHCPHEANSTRRDWQNYAPIKLTPEQQSLL